MFDDITAYYHENVVSSYLKYREISRNRIAGRSLDLREALTAANALFHLREHLSTGGLSRREVERLCPDYALLGDIANVSKHKSLTGNTPHGAPLVNDAASLGETILVIEYEDSAGTYRHIAKTVVVKLTDGTERVLLDVLTNVINFWETYMTSIGLLSEARTFVIDDPLRARTRAECEESKLDFEIVRGQRLYQSVQMLRFNKDTEQVEPIDITGWEPTARIYCPSFDFDIRLRNDVTGEELQKTITLSESDSLEISKLLTDVEKQAYANSLPQVQDALRQLAIEAGLAKE